MLPAEEYHDDWQAASPAGSMAAFPSDRIVGNASAVAILGADDGLLVVLRWAGLCCRPPGPSLCAGSAGFAD